MNTDTQINTAISLLEIKDGTFVSEIQNQKTVEILNQNFDWLVQLKKIFLQQNKDKKHVVITCINIQNQNGQDLAGRFTHGETFPPEKKYHCTFASKEILQSCIGEPGEENPNLLSNQENILLVLFDKDEYVLFRFVD